MEFRVYCTVLYRVYESYHLFVTKRISVVVSMWKVRVIVFCLCVWFDQTPLWVQQTQLILKLLMFGKISISEARIRQFSYVDRWTYEHAFPRQTNQLVGLPQRVLLQNSKPKIIIIKSNSNLHSAYVICKYAVRWNATAYHPCDTWALLCRLAKLIQFCLFMENIYSKIIAIPSIECIL